MTGYIRVCLWLSTEFMVFGDVISGNYAALLDDHFLKYRFSVTPANGGTFTINPGSGGSCSRAAPLTQTYAGSEDIP